MLSCMKRPSPRTVYTVLVIASLLISFPSHSALATAASQETEVKTKTIEIPFTSHEGYEMLGKLTIPTSGAPHAVVIYVQTAEGMTIDMKRRGARGATFNYFDLYREKLPEMNVGFFSYEGRGIRMGDQPPRFEAIDWDVYNTSTLENKVRDILSAVTVVQKQDGVYPVLDNWAETSAGVNTPKGWFKDHFHHQPIWTFLSRFDNPVGFFQGAMDTSVPIAGVRRMEAAARQAGKTQMEFHYFDNLDHTLGIGSYFVTGKLPEGHRAIFEFIRAQTRGAAGTPQVSADAAELSRLESVWNEAHLHGDAEALDRLWDDDLVVSVPNMPLMTKPGVMGIWRSGRMKFQRYDTSDIRIRVYDNAAVVTGRLQRARNANGKDYDDDWRFTKVYVRRDGRWQVVAWHASESARQ